ncbi:OmpA family protein [Aestuariibius sp. 2305UL40-4]|uniref:OmpA family protein n=1 Tax=Aestuariibius violaceus TaxID=3234132 RepID=UPI00345E7DEF
MSAADSNSSGSGKVFPRRTFVAGGLSALVAGGAVTLGTLGYATRPQTESFRFARSTTLAAGEDARLRGFLAQALPDDRMQVVIIGHTGDAGNADANLALSAERADVAAAMARALGILPNRITVTGVGGASPLPKLEGERARAHQSRLARVEVSLQMRR